MTSPSDISRLRSSSPLSGMSRGPRSSEDIEDMHDVAQSHSSPSTSTLPPSPPHPVTSHSSYPSYQVNRHAPLSSSPLNPSTFPQDSNGSSNRSSSSSSRGMLASQKTPSNASMLLQGTFDESRAVGKVQDTVDIQNSVTPEEKLKFYRCLDTDLLPSRMSLSERAKAVGILDTLQTILENALTRGLGEPADCKYLQIKLSNPAIQNRLMLDARSTFHGKGSPALDFLHLCGWRPMAVDFQEYYRFPDQPTAQQVADLRVGSAILSQRLSKEKEAACEREERQKQAQVEEANRKATILMQIKADRRARQDRDELVREMRRGGGT